MPAAFNGILEKPGQSDTFHITAKKGETWKIRVYGRTLGAPIDPKIWVANAKTGKHVLDADVVMVVVTAGLLGGAEDPFGRGAETTEAAGCAGTAGSFGTVGRGAFVCSDNRCAGRTSASCGSLAVGAPGVRCK